MGEKKTGRGKLIATAVILFVVIAGALGFIGMQYGSTRALTVAVAILVIAVLVWVILTAVSLLSLLTSRRTPSPESDQPVNTQRPVPKRAPIIADQDPGPGERRTGHRRKDS